MNPTFHYSYRLSGRRVMTVFALGVSAVMLAFAVRYQAPWYFYAPVVLAAAMLVWLIIHNPQSGADLSADAFHFFHNGKEQTVRLADIAHMTVSRWTEGPDTVALYLKSGDVIHVPSLCADSKLAPALRDAGVVEV